MLLDELKVDYPKPSMLLEDNAGAIFIMKNDQVGQRTKHIDVKFHHIRDMIKARDLVVLYIRSEDNPADIMTKNTKEVLFIKHALSMKKGVLLVGAIGALNHREDVVDMVEVIRHTDEGIFVGVPSPKGILGVDEISTDRGPNKLDHDLDADKRPLSEEASDAGNSVWVTVKSKGSKKRNK